jgi:hypothetical protein
VTPTNFTPVESRLVETEDRADAYILVAAWLVEQGRGVCLDPDRRMELNPEELKKIREAGIPESRMPYTIITNIQEWKPVTVPAGRFIDE